MDADLYIRNRLTAPAPAGAKPPPGIIWPDGWEPKFDRWWFDSPGQAFPAADVVVVTWTVAEAQALADLCVPTENSIKTQWAKYTKDWDSYKKQLTGRSPASQAGCAAMYQGCTIRDKRVLLVKSELHLSTDGETLPVTQLWEALARETGAKLIITTGTAGGIHPLQFGDVLVTNAAKFNCTKRFKNEPYAQRRFANGASLPMAALIHQIEQTISPVYPKLQEAGLTVRPPYVQTRYDVETVDYFGFADATDSYGVVKADPRAGVEEMDDATLPLALSELSGIKAPAWLVIRNASDPQVPAMAGGLRAEVQWAAKIYQKYGYYTSLCSVIACVGYIAAM